MGIWHKLNFKAELTSLEACFQDLPKTEDQERVRVSFHSEAIKTKQLWSFFESGALKG